MNAADTVRVMVSAAPALFLTVVLTFFYGGSNRVATCCRWSP